MLMAFASSESKCPEGESIAVNHSLLQFRAPRYWRVWLLVAWLRFSSCLPWRVAVGLHAGIGRIFWRLAPGRRRIVTRNIELAFPDLDRGSIRRLVRRHFESLAICMAEAAFAWFGKVDQALTDFEVEGDEHVYAALTRGRGVILYTGHFTSVEMFGPVLSEIFPLFGFMFHERRNALLNEVQRRGRRFSGRLSIPSNNVRAMLRALNANSVIWYAPDQDFSERSSTVLPFFGKPVSVSTATFRLARATGAAIVPFLYKRLEDGSGYLLHFDPAIEAPDNDDELACTGRLLEVLEGFIRQCPEQQRLKVLKTSKGKAGDSVAADEWRRGPDSAGAFVDATDASPDGHPQTGTFASGRN
jgi:KDO2-lipid IV(A) lauroyltransferase